MDWNVYVGTDVFAVVQGLLSVDEAVDQVIDSDINARALTIATHIELLKPDVVFLQEAWQMAEETKVPLFPGLAKPGVEARASAALETRNAFLQQQRIGLGSLDGWNRFVMLSARSFSSARSSVSRDGPSRRL